MDEFLTRAESCAMTRPVIATGLREHVHAVATARLRTGYSPELAEADVALTRAITEYQFGRGASTLHEVRERLRDFHAAAFSTAYTHSPIQQLTELATGFSSAHA